jgi:enediyne biosynthesis protein CalE5
MDIRPFDPIQYKDRQRQLWDSVAVGWETWWPVQEEMLQCVSDRLLDMAGILQGHLILDVGTGIGEPAITAGRRAGSAGYVVATDQSPQMLAIAQKRADALGLKNLEFRVMDAERIDFPEGSFDSILSRFSLMFLPGLFTFLAKIRRMLAPGGKFAASVWGTAPQVPMASIAFDLAREMFHVPPPPAEAPSLFCLAGGILERALSHSGFTDVHAEELTCTLMLPSAKALVQFLRDVNVPLVSMLANQTDEQQAGYWHALETAAQTYATTDGSIQLPNAVICVVGQR